MNLSSGRKDALDLFFDELPESYVATASITPDEVDITSIPVERRLLRFGYITNSCHDKRSLARKGLYL
jgi:hypothetical protein